MSLTFKYAPLSCALVTEERKNGSLSYTVVAVLHRSNYAVPRWQVLDEKYLFEALEFLNECPKRAPHQDLLVRKILEEHI